MAFDSTNFEKPQVDEVGQIILKARELLSDPKRWRKGTPRKGDSFCIIGAVYQCGGGYDRTDHTEYPSWYLSSIDRLAKAIDPTLFGPSAVTGFNDRSTHADVLALLDRAAKGGQP